MSPKRKPVVCARVPLPARFWACVQKSEACWLWLGQVGAQWGYGYFFESRKMVRAHRYSMSLAIGRPVRSDELVLHRCDNPPCVNPAHLFLGTHQDNTDDMVRKGRARPSRGSANGFAKLTEDQVVEILAALAAGVQQKDLAAKYGVSRQPIWMIAHGKAWNHVRRSQ